MNSQWLDLLIIIKGTGYYPILPKWWTLPVMKNSPL